MIERGLWGWQQASWRLAAALAVSACGHAAVLANVAFGPGLTEFALFTQGRPLSARLAQAPVPGPASGDARELSPPRLAPTPGAAPAAVVAQHPAQPAAAAGLPSAEIYFRGSEVDERATALGTVDVLYPEAALAAGTRGVVTLRLLIDHEGRLRDASVRDSSPSGVFDNAALEAVLSLRFRPAMRNGVPVGSIKIIEVPFEPDCLRTGSCIK